MATLMFGLAVLVGAAQEWVVNMIKAGTSNVRRWSGVVLVGIGLWLLALTIWADLFARFFPV